MQISYLDGLTPQLVYVTLSAVVAVLIWTEGEMLKKTEGKLPQSMFSKFSSLLDTLWFFVSVVILYLVDLTPLAVAVPAAYGLYTVFGWVYGTRLLKSRGMPETPKDLVIPAKYIAYSQSFSLVFFALCLLVLSSPWLLMTR